MGEQLKPNFILEIDREDAYLYFAESIGKPMGDMTVAERNIAIARRVIMNGVAMLDTALFYERDNEQAT